MAAGPSDEGQVLNSCRVSLTDKARRMPQPGPSAASRASGAVTTGDRLPLATSGQIRASPDPG